MGIVKSIKIFGIAGAVVFCGILAAKVFSAGKEIGILRGKISVLEIKNEQLQNENKNFTKQNGNLQKEIRNLQKSHNNLQETYMELQNENAYISALKDTLQNRYSTLYRTYYQKRFDIKQLKIEVSQPTRKGKR